MSIVVHLTSSAPAASRERERLGPEPVEREESSA